MLFTDVVPPGEHSLIIAKAALRWARFATPFPSRILSPLLMAVAFGGARRLWQNHRADAQVEVGLEDDHQLFLELLPWIGSLWQLFKYLLKVNFSKNSKNSIILRFLNLRKWKKTIGTGLWILLIKLLDTFWHCLYLLVMKKHPANDTSIVAKISYLFRFVFSFIKLCNMAIDLFSLFFL